MIKRTLVIIKPNVIKMRAVGRVISRFEENGFEIIGTKMIKLTREEAESFYHMHRSKPFFQDLVEFMTSEKCIAMVVEGKLVITNVRNFIGATNPKEAKPGTIRAEFGESLSRNAVHASDSIEASKFEVNFFFPELAW